MKNYQQTVKQRRVKLNKFKHVFALSRSNNKAMSANEFKVMLRNKRWKVGNFTGTCVDWDLSFSHALGIYLA